MENHSTLDYETLLRIYKKAAICRAFEEEVYRQVKTKTVKAEKRGGGNVRCVSQPPHLKIPFS